MVVFVISESNIVIGDFSAFYFHRHTDGMKGMGEGRATAPENPLESCATSVEELSAFNVDNPLYGKPPIDVLVCRREMRRTSPQIRTHLCSFSLPSESFYKLRDKLYIASPELTLARLGYGHSKAQIARFASDLCARYYLSLHNGKILARSNLLTTRERLRRYLESISGMHGATQALHALDWVLDNSGSPAETQSSLLFRIPRCNGGFGLPFDAMNYDVPAGRRARFAEQGWYCIDLVNTRAGVGLEYDGTDSHPDPSADNRRRNALLAMGWNIIAIDKSVLNYVDATEKAALQVAKILGIRIQKPRNWEAKHLNLRRDLGLPAK